MHNAVLRPAEILLPAKEADLSRWAVVACDQFTSQPEYWQQVDEFVGSAPSTLRIMLPEIFLEESDAPERIANIHSAMRSYCKDVLSQRVQGFVYVERSMQNGSIRQGLVGCVDLEDYSFEASASCAIRPSEHTIVERIPPRLKVRREAYLESPHILMLADDAAKSVIEPLAERKEGMELLYDLEMMQGGGKIKGWAVTSAQDLDFISQSLRALQNEEDYNNRYKGTNAVPPFVFAVGDGNHSLATAKAHWQEIKEQLPQSEWEAHPARYCLVELENIHSAAIEIEPILRVVYGIDGEALLKELKARADAEGASIVLAEGAGQGDFGLLVRGEKSEYALKSSPWAMTVGALDKYLEAVRVNGVPLKIDYIHGEAELKALSNKGAVGILLPPLQKSDLFRGIALGGVLPKKTFSMGHAEEKRYYMECRRIEQGEK